jgi:hypothetical protein
MKTCTLCNETKPLSAFNKNNRYKDGHYKHCKKCHYEVYGRDAHFRKAYNITQKDYNSAVEKLNYKCQVCEADATNSSTWSRLVVDHCHTTGEIRGFLCQPCNMALGSARDNPTILRKLANYLEDFSGTDA